MALNWPPKDPDEVLDYGINWSELIDEGDEISASTWVVPTGITKNSDTFDAPTSTTTIWLSSGTIGTTYELTNRIVTAGGRTRDQSVRLKVKEK